MNDVLRIARLKIALQRAFLGRAILIFTLFRGTPKVDLVSRVCSNMDRRHPRSIMAVIRDQRPFGSFPKIHPF